MKKAQATNNQGPVYFLKSLGSWWQGQQEEEKWRYRSLICCVGRHCGHFCCSGLHYLQEPVVYWSQPHLIGPDLYMLTLDLGVFSFLHFLIFFQKNMVKTNNYKISILTPCLWAPGRLAPNQWAPGSLGTLIWEKSFTNRSLGILAPHQRAPGPLCLYKPSPPPSPSFHSSITHKAQKKERVWNGETLLVFLQGQQVNKLSFLSSWIM